MTDETDDECLARLLAEGVQEDGWIYFARPLNMQELRVMEAWTTRPRFVGELHVELIA